MPHSPSCSHTPTQIIVWKCANIGRQPGFICFAQIHINMWETTKLQSTHSCCGNLPLLQRYCGHLECLSHKNSCIKSEWNIRKFAILLWQNVKMRLQNSPEKAVSSCTYLSVLDSSARLLTPRITHVKKPNLSELIYPCKYSTSSGILQQAGDRVVRRCVRQHTRKQWTTEEKIES